MDVLACTVRGCGRPLAREPRRFVCAAAHAYDIARSGYVNLLQPQDRRSPDAGDTREAVDARARLLDAGIGAALIEAVAGAVSELGLDAGAHVVDAGCGTGHALAAIASRLDVAGIGIDLSAAAIDYAARRHPLLTWAVANVDRQLPLTGGNIDLVLSINARHIAAEAHRVLRPGGHLLMAVPAPEDLQELRASVQGAAVSRDRVEPLVAGHAALFEVERRWATREQHVLQPDLLRDLLRVTYRGARRSQAERTEALSEMTVTFASDLVLFAARA